MIFQKVRDAEQEKIYGEFAPRLGEIVMGVYRRDENEAIILEVNKTDVLFPSPRKALQRGLQARRPDPGGHRPGQKRL